MTEKKISRNTHVWAHVGTIIFHTLLGVYLVYLSTKTSQKNIKTPIFILGVVLAVVSLMSLWPIVKKYDRIIIE